MCGRRSRRKEGGTPVPRPASSDCAALRRSYIGVLSPAHEAHGKTGSKLFAGPKSNGPRNLPINRKAHAKPNRPPRPYGVVQAVGKGRGGRVRSRVAGAH